jgi:hypothetical protein
VAVLVLGILVGIRLVGDGGPASPRPSVLLGPGAELDGMRLTTAYDFDSDIFTYCDPIILQYGTYARDCEVPQLGRLMIGHGALATSQELLEQEWQAQRWRLYLDGQEVDLSAFGTLPDRSYVDTDLGEVWVRQWAVTLVYPTRGQHTLRYVMEQSPAGDDPGGASDTTWTFTV